MDPFRIKYFLLFFLLLLICHEQLTAQKELIYFGKKFSYHLVIDSVGRSEETYWDSSVKSITIYRLKDNKKIQTIIPTTNKFHKAHGDNYFIVDDMNFDGFEDCKLLYAEKGMNQSFLYWLYDPGKGRFIENKELENITSANFDQKKKRITSSWRGGAGDYGYDEYIYRNGKYLLIRADEDIHRQDHYLVIRKKRMNGKIVTIKNRRFSEKSYNNYPDRLIPL